MAAGEIIKEIDGKTYSIHKRTATESIKLLTSLIKLIGPAMAKALGEDETSETSIPNLAGIMEKKLDLPGMINILADKLDEDQTVNLIKTILKETILKGDGGGRVYESFDTLFAGNLKHLFKVVKEVLMVEYQSFFQGEQENQ